MNWFSLFRRQAANDDNYLDVKAEPGSESRLPATSLSGSFFTSRARRREQQLQTLQNGYRELTDLIRSVREGLDQQAQVQAKMLEVMQSLPPALDSLRDAGRVAEKQTEIMELVQKRMESDSQRNEQFGQTIEKFNDSLASLEEATQQSAHTVAAIGERSRESEESVKELLVRSERRMMIFAAVVLAVVVGAVAALFVALRPATPVPMPAPAQAGQPAEPAAPDDDAGEVEAAEPAEEAPAGGADAAVPAGADEGEVAEPATELEPGAEPKGEDDLPENESEPADPSMDVG